MSGAGDDTTRHDSLGEAHFERIVERSGDAVYSLDPDGRFTYANAAHEALTGYSQTDLVGEHVSTVVDDVEGVESTIRALLADEDRRTALHQVDIVTREGERIPTEVHLSLLIDDGGEFLGTTGVVRDVRDRKRRERELQELEAIVETVPDGVLVIDDEGIVVDANRTAAWMFDFEDGGLVGQPFDRVVSGVVGEGSLEDRYTDLLGNLFIAEAIGEQARFEYEATVEGERRVFEANLAFRPAEDGEFRGTIGVVRDITERREHERTLERYETIVEASGEAVYALDVEGRFTFTNQAQAEILGYDRDELLGMHFSEVVDDADVVLATEIVQALRESDERRHETFELTLITGEGRRIPAENHLALLSDEDGRFRGTAGIARDVSDRKERERALERQNERLERVASVLSHDLRNPLNVAIGRVQIARDDGEPDHLEVAEEALGRMSDLIDDVLSLARQGQTVVEPDVVGLVSAVESAWGSVDTEEATVEVADPLGSIRAEGSRLQRLFENLFRNAVEHAGPACTVRVGVVGEAKGYFVEDDGPGIPPGERDQVFQFGWSTSDHGTGYGLAIAKEIAEAHGWEIVAVEGEDGGARFEVTGVEWVSD